MGIGVNFGWGDVTCPFCGYCLSETIVQQTVGGVLTQKKYPKIQVIKASQLKDLINSGKKVQVIRIPKRKHGTASTSEATNRKCYECPLSLYLLSGYPFWRFM